MGHTLELMEFRPTNVEILGRLIEPLLVEMNEAVPQGDPRLGGRQFAKVTQGNVGGEVVLLLDPQTDQIRILVDRPPELEKGVVERLGGWNQAGRDRPRHDHNAHDLKLERWRRSVEGVLLKNLRKAVLQLRIKVGVGFAGMLVIAVPDQIRQRQVQGFWGHSGKGLSTQLLGKLGLEMMQTIVNASIIWVLFPGWRNDGIARKGNRL